MSEPWKTGTHATHIFDYLIAQVHRTAARRGTGLETPRMDILPTS